ncbi:MAG: sialate O-acetylesterase, partial [Duncaniella sp.]|nr:sialate O-acetylesterase [Duncaniella sp.]
MGDDRVSLAGQWGYHIGVPRAEQPRKPETPASQNYPGNLYNSMIHPLKNFPVRGAIWYQGESNVDRWEQYTPLFQAMINNWRDDWGKDMPFYFVQLANFLERHDVQPGSTWAHLREAQANALQLDNTGMAVAIDIGEAYDIHPKNKQEVGARLARAALAGTYGKGTYAAPRFESMKVKGDKAVITMDRPVTVKGDKPTGFVVCGADMQFHPADVIVEKNVITVTAPGVKHPVAVRYGWADNPACNLYGSDGLPVAPFRTDCYR